MIPDHGVRTLYEEKLKSGYMLEKDNKFDMARSRYNDALTIAESFDDNAEISRCHKILYHLDKKINKTDDTLTF